MTASASIRRLFEMALGFASACLVVAFAFNVIIGTGTGDDGAEIATLVWQAFLFTPKMALLVAMLAVFIAAPTMIMAERRSRRSFGYALIAGAASGVPVLILWLAMAYYSDSQMDEFLTAEAAMFPLTFLSLGMLGGIVYWAIAGRRANNFQPAEPAR